MASVYTTARGKNKKAKLGMRKDAANNAANKLSVKVQKSALESLFDAPEERKVLTLGSSEQRRKTALLKAQERLQLTAEDAAATLPSSVEALSLSSAPPSLAACQSAQCIGKAEENKGEGRAGGAAPKLLLCGGCRLVSYCSAACQKQDWPQHKVACKHTQSLLRQSAEAAAADSAVTDSEAVALSSNSSTSASSSSCSSSSSTSVAAASSNG